MPCYVFLNECHSPHSRISRMYPQFSLYVCKDPFQCVVRIGHVQLWIAIERPQPRHVAFETEVCAPESFMCV